MATSNDITHQLRFRRQRVCRMHQEALFTILSALDEGNPSLAKYGIRELIRFHQKELSAIAQEERADCVQFKKASAMRWYPVSWIGRKVSKEERLAHWVGQQNDRLNLSRPHYAEPLKRQFD